MNAETPIKKRLSDNEIRSMRDEYDARGAMWAAFDELLSHRHPAPVADERAEVGEARICADGLEEYGAVMAQGDDALRDLLTKSERFLRSLSAQPSGALERESVGNAAGQKLSAKWFEDFHLVFEDGEVEDWPEVARKLLGHIEACKIDEAQLESATEEIERLQAKLSAPPPERAPGGDALRLALDKSPMLKKFLEQGFWHAHYVDIVWRFNGEDVREQGDWLKDLFYLVRRKPTIEQLEHALTRTDLKVEMLPDGSVVAVEKERPAATPQSSSPSATADATLRAALESGLKDIAAIDNDHYRNGSDYARGYGSGLYFAKQIAKRVLADAALAGNEGEKL